MSLRTPDLLFTAIAPAIWGSTYIVTTQYLPNFSPMTVAMLRALPAGLLLVMIVRQIPTGIWWMRIFILGALNISLFWSLLFISVYRLPGGRGRGDGRRCAAADGRVHLCRSAR